MFEDLDPQYAAGMAECTNRLMVEYGIPIPTDTSFRPSYEPTKRD